MTPYAANPIPVEPPPHAPGVAATATPPSRPPGRWLPLVVFWLGLGAAVAPWWVNTPAGSLDGAAAAYTAAGRITGLVGGYVLVVQVVLMSRLRRLERRVGSRLLGVWHREIGGFVVVAVLAHTVLITAGYAGLAEVSFPHETWSLLTGDSDLLSAYAATALLLGVGLLGVRSLRRALRYEVWYALHVTSYLVLLLGFGHQFSSGQELIEPGAARTFWTALYAAAAVAVLWGRLFVPLGFNLRHRLRVAAVVDEAPDMISVYVRGRRLDRLHASAGQFFRWRFLTRRLWTQAHPFSLSAAPNGRWLRLTVKTVGDHTEAMRWLRPGTPVYADGPYGEFTAERRTRLRALLIAGGSGIAPIRALLEELPPGAVVVYRASTVEDLAFRQELEWLARERDAALWYVLGSRESPGPARLFTQRGLRELVPDIARRDVYLCGPDGLVTTSLKLLRRLRVPRRQIHVDPFEL
jgi:predicted ferric reductase